MFKRLGGMVCWGGTNTWVLAPHALGWGPRGEGPVATVTRWVVSLPTRAARASGG